MMKKRILISTLALLFMVSTTGLPIFYHYCEMIGQMSLSECQSCLQEEEKSFSCCPMDESNYGTQLKAESSTCCIDEFDYKKIEDNFFQTINSNIISATIIVTESSLTSIDSQDENRFSQQTNYDIPPPKFGKQLLNTLHQLKIDSPVC